MLLTHNYTVLPSRQVEAEEKKIYMIFSHANVEMLQQRKTEPKRLLLIGEILE